MQMKYSDLISGIFWFVFGLLLSIWSTFYRIGSIKEPGPGFLPLGVGLLLILFSIILLGQACKSSLLKEAGPPLFSLGGWKKVAYSILIVLVATLFFERMGYLLTVFLLIFFLMLGDEPKSWKRNLFIAFLTTVGVYLIFVLLLEQPLPRGFLRI